MLPDRGSQVERYGRLRHDAEANDAAEEVEHVEVRRAVGLRVQEEALSVRSNLRPIVGCFDQEWQDAGLQLSANVDQGVTEWATVIHRTFTSKVNLPAAFVRALLLEVIKAGITAFDLLESLAEDGLFALVVNMASFTEVKGLSSAYSDVRSWSFI